MIEQKTLTSGQARTSGKKELLINNPTAELREGLTLNNSVHGSVAVDEDKGSTESEGSTDEDSDSLDNLSDESEFNELTKEDQMMEMAIIKNFLGRRQTRGNSSEDVGLQTSMKMTHDSERQDSVNSNRISRPLAGDVCCYQPG